MSVTTTLDSKNKKLYGHPGSPKWKGWPIAATSRKIGLTAGGSCPSGCRFLPKADGGNGACYAAGGPQGFVQRRSGADENDGAAVAAFIRNLPPGYWVRHHVSGDFALNGQPDYAYIQAVVQAHRDRPDVTGWAYTHLWRELDPAAFGPLTVRASCETPQEVMQARAAGWATVMVGRSGETRRSWHEDGARFALCPEVAVGTACRYCGICARKDDLTIVFPAHGQAARTADRMLDQLIPLPVAGD